MPQNARRADSTRASIVQNGEAIKALREANGWRLSKFATAVMISHGALSNIEANRRNASPEVLRRIADTLGVPLAAIKNNGFTVDQVA
jgi:transcriptional regulator with XRE-family HTH domain